MKLELCHVDTCLPSYWSGHHLPHVQIPVWRGMTLVEIKNSLKYELMEGAIMGSDYRLYIGSQDYDEAYAEEWADAAFDAVARLLPNDPGQRTFFDDVEDEDSESVYAFFVFVPID